MEALEVGITDLLAELLHKHGNKVDLDSVPKQYTLETDAAIGNNVMVLDTIKTGSSLTMTTMIVTQG